MTIIGKQYKILAELGAGGMGIVYHAVDTMLEREVAVKKLRSEFSRSPDIAERFRREAKIQARLSHSNLAHLYSFFQESDSLYIVMEFVSGSPLSSLVPLTWQQALRIFIPILDSLEYAHSLGVLHRDIKPDNIMISARGEVKVMDFGIAHVIGSSRQTREKSIIGTLEYISPEQISGKELSPRSDIYSLGALLFEVISGRLPFEAEAEYALLRHHLETPPPKVSTVVPGVPAFLDDAIERAMAKTPDERFTSCREMSGTLRSAAPDVFSQPMEPLPNRTEEKEVERYAKRIEALIAGAELDLASLVVAQALRDYPEQAAFAGYAPKIAELRGQKARVQNADEKSAFLKDVLENLARLEQAGDLDAARAAAEQGLKRYPGMPALAMALAHWNRPPDA